MGEKLYVIFLSVALAWPSALRAADEAHGNTESADSKEGETAKEGSESKETEKTKEEKKKEEAKKDSEAVDKFKALGDKATEKDLVAIEDKIKELSIKQNAEETPDAERTKLINDLYGALSQYRMVQDIAATNAANLANETAAMQAVPIPEAPPPPAETVQQAVEILKIAPAPPAAAASTTATQSFAGPVNLSGPTYTPPAVQKKVSLTPIQNVAPAQVPAAPAPVAKTPAEPLPIRVSSSNSRGTPSMTELPPLPAQTYSQSSDRRPQAPLQQPAPPSQPVASLPQEFSAPAQPFENTPSLSVIRSGTSEAIVADLPAPAREMTTITITSLESPAKESTVAEPDSFSPPAQKEGNNVAWNPPDVSAEGRALFQVNALESTNPIAENEATEKTEQGGELENFRQEKAGKKKETSDLTTFMRAKPRR